MTLVIAKYDNFIRFIYDAVTPVWKLFEKNKKFWYILASSGIKQ